MTTVEGYNNFVEIQTDVASFAFCDKSIIGKATPVDGDRTMLDLCNSQHFSYLTCIEFAPDEEVKQRHVCNIFPVMLGSQLDIDITKQKFGTGTAKVPELAGSFVIDGSLTIIPFLMTNRKEMGHRTAVDDIVFRLFVYDKSGRGHRITLDTAGKVQFRDYLGKNVDAFDKDSNFAVHLKYLDFENIPYAFRRISDLDIEIDSLENKLIYSPNNLFKLMLTMAKGKPEKALDYMSHGQIEKFASKNIIFEMKKPKFPGDTSVSCNFRTISPNQIGRHGNERLVFRPMPVNVTRGVIKDTEYFMCLAEKSISIGSFHSTMKLMDNIYICDDVDISRNCLNTVLEALIECGYIRKTRSFETDVLVVVNGGLLTKFSAVVGFDEMFQKIKSINQFVEVIFNSKVFMLNQYRGIPFCPVGDILVSPFEMNRYFKGFKENTSLDVFGPNCTENAIKYAQYSNFTKTMVGVNFHKNRFGCEDMAKYFKYTPENNCVYIQDSNKNYNKDKGVLDMKLAFSSHPQITADGYILSNRSPINTIVVQRSRFELEITNEIEYELCNFKSSDCMIETDRMGNVTKKHLCVVKFFKLGGEIPFRIFPQTKFYVNKTKTRNGFVYLLFKYFDERPLLESDFDIEVSANVIGDKKRRLYYDLITKSKVSHLDGTKLSNLSSQKGLAVSQDVSRVNRHLGVDVDVVGSLFSIVGRAALPQLKAMSGRLVEGASEFVGVDEMDLLKNQSSIIKSCSPVKCDLYWTNICLTNGLYLTNYGMYQRSYKKSERKRPFPKDCGLALSVLNICKRGFRFSDSSGNIHDEFNVNNFAKKKKIN